MGGNNFKYVTVTPVIFEQKGQKSKPQRLIEILDPQQFGSNFYGEQYLL